MHNLECIIHNLRTQDGNIFKKKLAPITEQAFSLYNKLLTSFYCQL